LKFSEGYRANLVLHTQQFVLWVMAKFRICPGPDGTLVSEFFREDSAKLLERALFDPKRLYVERYILARAANVSPESLRSICSSLRVAYDYWGALGLTEITSASITNPTGAFGKRIAIAEAWLGAENFKLAVVNTRRHALSQYFTRVIANTEGLKKIGGPNSRRERRAYEALHQANDFGERLIILERPVYRNTLTAELLLNAKIHIERYLREISFAPDATVLTIRDLVSTVKRFYAWLSEQGFSGLDSSFIRNPLSSLAVDTRTPSRGRKVHTRVQREVKKAPIKVEVQRRAHTKKPPEAKPTERHLRRVLLRVPNAADVLKRRDRFVTELLRARLPSIGLSEIAGIRLSHLSESGESLRIPIPHMPTHSFPLTATLQEQLGEYLEALESSRELERKLGGDERTHFLFPSLDGGALLVDDSQESVVDDPIFVRFRNAAIETFVRETKWGFGLTRALRVGHFSNSLSELCLRGEGKLLRESLPSSVVRANKAFAEHARETELRYLWNSDPTHSPFYFACDGQMLTADEVL